MSGKTQDSVVNSRIYWKIIEGKFYILHINIRRELLEYLYESILEGKF